MRRALIVMSVGATWLAACQKPEAYVECKPNGAVLAAGFSCTLEHRAGARPLHACWSLNITCANGARGTAEACGDVQPKAKAGIGMPYALFKNTLDRCDQVTASNVQVRELTQP